MNSSLSVKNGISIPEHELEFKTSRSGGAGGQHVNKTESKVTVRWNIKNSTALNDKQRERMLKNLESKLTLDGDLIISNSESRSQVQNKEKALSLLAQEVRKALFIPKKRIKTRTPKKAIEARLKSKKHLGEIKKMRSKKIDY